MPRVRVGRIHLWAQQAGSGPDLVLLHGLGANRAFWDLRTVRSLGRHFRVTLYDLRGHGYSDMPPAGYTSAAMAADLRGLMQALGIHAAHLVGHSYGGLVALHFAVRYPARARSLVLADTRIPGLQPRLRLKDWPQWALWKRELGESGIHLDEEQEIDYRVLADLASRRWEGARGRTGPAAFVPFAGWNAERRGAERWLRLLRHTSAGRDFKAPAGLTPERIRRLRLPVLALFGEYSFCLPSCRALERVLPQSRAVIVPGAGHFHPRVRPDDFARSVHEFLLPAAGDGAGSPCAASLP